MVVYPSARHNNIAQSYTGNDNDYKIKWGVITVV